MSSASSISHILRHFHFGSASNHDPSPPAAAGRRRSRSRSRSRSRERDRPRPPPLRVVCTLLLDDLHSVVQTAGRPASHAAAAATEHSADVTRVLADWLYELQSESIHPHPRESRFVSLLRVWMAVLVPHADALPQEVGLDQLIKLAQHFDAHGVPNAIHWPPGEYLEMTIEIMHARRTVCQVRKAVSMRGLRESRFFDAKRLRAAYPSDSELELDEQSQKLINAVAGWL